jgi:hypothetical protein
MLLVLLDLEETVIDTWAQRRPLDAQLAWIKAFLAEQSATQPVRLGLLSAAVHHDHELDTFNTELRPWLEETLGHAFDDRWTLGLLGWADEVWRTRGMRLELSDFWDLVQKPELLFLLAQSHPEWEGTTVKLIDDAFTDGLTIQVPARGCEVNVVNIKARVPLPSLRNLSGYVN